MHTAVLVLGMLLILSELGAFGFMMLNTMNHYMQPKAAIHLVPNQSKSQRHTIKVVVVENKKVQTTTIEDPAEKSANKMQAGYFTLVP